jgi:hypothetical protein
VSVQPDDIAEQYCVNCHDKTTGDVVVANWTDPWDEGKPPVLRLPRIGCSVVTHAALGWCGACPRVVLSVEALGWRYHASRAMIPGYTGAVRMTVEFATRPVGSGR